MVLAYVVAGKAVLQCQLMHMVADEVHLIVHQMAGIHVQHLVETTWQVKAYARLRLEDAIVGKLVGREPAAGRESKFELIAKLILLC